MPIKGTKNCMSYITHKKCFKCKNIKKCKTEYLLSVGNI